MKKLLPILLAIASLGLFSCGKSSDNKPAGDGSANWKIGDYAYTLGSSTQQTSQSGNNGLLTVIVGTTVGQGGDYGPFSGSSVTVSFYSSLGEGTYTLGSTEMMVANPGTRILHLDCNVGTAVNTGSIMYSCVNNGGTADVTKGSDGKYHVTVKNAVTLVKNVTVGGGIPSAKDNYSFTMENMH
ncbi:hypothetical protein J2T02_004978 [Chitinophaga terrae (ex Kim and Jung 2007)]|nr:hypothetical protein [Chitinophaga terrae (ex Kim and Jung 2007)]MDQ0109833.1 hypothetical protein [Chitinophaga terrae (ex Kim and Jung 2007)]